MKHFHILLFIIFTPIAIFSQTYKVGDYAQGGIVFWVDETGEHGLVCARHDQTFLENWETGKARCESYFGIANGQMVKGWRLPTKEEIAIMRQQRDLIDKTAAANGGEAFDKGIGSYYWSSTTEGDAHAWTQAFGFDNPHLMGKVSTNVHSRAVREF